MNTASPEMLDLAPKDLPWKTGPSYQRSSTQKFLHTPANVTYPDCECGSVMGDWSSTRPGVWHGTASTSFNSS